MFIFFSVTDFRFAGSGQPRVIVFNFVAAVRAQTLHKKFGVKIDVFALAVYPRYLPVFFPVFQHKAVGVRGDAVIMLPFFGQDVKAGGDLRRIAFLRVLRIGGRIFRFNG